ncbi:MAG: endo-1,4-beta-xylanase [Planctomycetota bacterium]
MKTTLVIWLVLMVAQAALGDTTRLRVVAQVDDSQPADEAIQVDWDADAVAVTRQSDIDTPAAAIGPVLRIEGAAEPQDTWRAQIRIPTQVAIERGDSLVAEAWLRGRNTDGTEPYVFLLFESDQPHYTKSMQHSVAVTSERWTRVTVPFEVARTSDVGQSRLALRVTSPLDHLEVAGFRVIERGGGDVDPTPATYPGIGPDASWREQAKRQIDQHRKAELTVRVVDTAGKPLPDVEVEVEMTRHAFPFGTAVAAPTILDDSDDADRYREIVRTWFNYATMENALKQPVIDRNGIEPAIEAMRWLDDNGLAIRGHTLVWPSLNRSHHLGDVGEEYRERAAVDEDAATEWLRAKLHQHVVKTAMRTRGMVVGWDIANEVANLRDIMEVLGDDDTSDDALVELFRLARQADPSAERYVNDYGIVVGDGTQHEVRARYLKQIANLVAAGEAPDAIGVQSHFFGHLTGPRRVWAILDELAASGVPIEITEFDVGAGDEELEGQFARDFMTACFAHPEVRAFVVWGFWEGRHWRPRTAMFRRDWSLRPAGEAWQDLVLDEWWTRETVSTDPTGTATVRAFLGDYVVRVGGSEVVTTLPSEGRTLRIELVSE